MLKLKILITGGTGFLGRALIPKLIADGHNVFLLTRQNAESGIARLHSNLVILKYKNTNEVSEIVKEISPEILLHLACCYGRHDESIAEVWDANVALGLNLLAAAEQDSNIKTIINVSSVLPKRTNYYSASKAQFSEILENYDTWSQGNLQVLDIAMESIFGPGDSITKFTTFLIQSCLKNVPKINLTLGEQKRDFLYIDDAVNAFRIIINSCSKLPSYEKISLGSGECVTIREFAELTHKITQSKSELVFGSVPYRSNELMQSATNIVTLNKLNWKPEISLTCGIKKTIELEEIS